MAMKLRDRTRRFSNSVFAYGFAVYSGLGGIFAGIETFAYATFLFIALLFVYIADVVLIFIGMVVSLMIKFLDKLTFKGGRQWR